MKGECHLSKIFMLSVTKRIDELEEVQSVMEKNISQEICLEGISRKGRLLQSSEKSIYKNQK